MVVQEHNQGHGGAVGSALAVGEDLGHVEHLEAADDGSDQGVGQDGADQGQGDGEKPLDAATAVQLGGLENFGADAHDGGHQHDGGVAEPHQEVHQPDQGAGAEGCPHEVNGRIGDPQAHQDGVDGAAVGEQGEEQHGKGRSHNQVGQIDDHLEELFAPDFQPHIGEPVGQQQGDDDLGHKADQPEDQGISCIFEQIRLQQTPVVFQAHKVGADLFDAGAVVLIEAVADGIHQRDQGKDEKAQEERDDKDISPFCIAQVFAFWLFHRSPFLSRKRPPPQKCAAAGLPKERQLTLPTRLR